MRLTQYFSRVKADVPPGTMDGDSYTLQGEGRNLPFQEEAFPLENRPYGREDVRILFDEDDMPVMVDEKGLSRQSRLARRLLARVRVAVLTDNVIDKIMQRYDLMDSFRDTVKEVKRAAPAPPGGRADRGATDAALILATIPRERIVLAQTPQVFRTTLLREAFARAQHDWISASDEASLVERLGHYVHVVAGSESNLKITHPGDMELAVFYLRQERSRTAEPSAVRP